MRVQELIEKRAKVWETAKNFVDTHEDKNGNLSAEDKETYSRMEAEIEELTNSIERQQRAERREQELSKPVNSPITGKPYKDEPQGEVNTGRASDEYKKAMLTALRSNFRQVSNVLQEGVDADGGYLVPEEYDHRLIDVLTEENIMRGIATKITTSGEHMAISVSMSSSSGISDCKNSSATFMSVCICSTSLSDWVLPFLTAMYLDLLKLPISRKFFEIIFSKWCFIIC